MGKELLIVRPGKIFVRDYKEKVLNDSEVRIQSVLSGISHGTEMNLYRGTAPRFHKYWDKINRVFLEESEKKSYPVTPGYESVGSVIEVGRKVQKINVGDLVWADRPHRTSHILSEREASAGKLSRNTTPEQGIFCAFSRIALGAVHDAQVKLGDRVAVIGVGALGNIILQLLQWSGANPIFAIDIAERRLKEIRGMAVVTINAQEEIPELKVKKVTQHQGVDVAIEVSGTYEGLQTAIRCCGIGGKVVTVSSYQNMATNLFLGEEFHRNRINLVSSMTINQCPHRSYPLWNLRRLNHTARYLLEHKLVQVEPLITHYISFDQAASAYQFINEAPNQSIKVALKYSDV